MMVVTPALARRRRPARGARLTRRAVFRSMSTLVDGGSTSSARGIWPTAEESMSPSSVRFGPSVNSRNCGDGSDTADSGCSVDK
jgi:hypothetical protein